MIGILLLVESYDEDAKADTKAKLSDEAKSYDKTKAIPTNFKEKRSTNKMQNFYILLPFSLITIAILIAVSIY